MFGFLKNLLRRSGTEPTAEDREQPRGTSIAASRPRYDSPPTAARAHRPVLQNGRAIELPLDKVLEGLPLELQPRVRQVDAYALTLSVPLEKILAQLSRGVVKVSFGELRQAVPDVFTAENDRDRMMVALPLGEILSRLNPTLITRRRAQQHIEVPADIASPFDLHGGNGFFSYSPPASATETPAAPAAPPRYAAPAPATPPPIKRGALSSVPAAVPPSTAPLGSKPRVPAAPGGNGSAAAAPAPQTPPMIPAPAPIAFNRPSPKAPSAAPTGHTTPPFVVPRKPAPSAPATPAVKPPPVAAAPAAPTAPTVKPPPAPPVRPAVPPPPAPPARPVVSRPPVEAAHQVPPAIPAGSNGPPAAAPAAAPAKPAEVVVFTLASLAEAWPEPVRKEIVERNLVDAQVGLPVSAVEQGLKQGRIVFSWNTIRSWLKPAVPATGSSHDGAVLELPLKVVAPVFLSRQKEHAKPHEKVAVDEEIPNLFFGSPQSENLPAAVTAPRPADTNFYVWGDSSDTVMVHESETKRGSSTPGTKFVAKYATPNEVVSRAAGLDGVAGALIALPDGLMVANRLPPELNGDTLAAFLPQIFGKVSQCTKELRMGELNNLNFTVGNVPWKIFRVNAIFFAAFGRAGEPLPTAQLAALAAELDHKPK